MRFLSIFQPAFAVGFLTFPTMLLAFDFAIDTRGNEDIQSDVEAVSLLKQISTDETKTPQEIVAAARADYQRVVTALYAKGFFAPIVNITLDGREAVSVSAISPPRRIQTAKISVKSGAKFKFGQAIVKPLASGTEISPEFASTQLASIGAIKDAASTAIEGWREVGHAKAAVGRQNITAQHAKNLINADLEIKPGPKLTFGDLIITGNKAVRTERIVDIAGLPTGRTFSPDELRRASVRLRRTGAFRVAALNEATNYNSDLSLDVEAQVTENLPRRFGFGAEISSLEGLSLSTFWLHRNLLGGAERLRVDGEISGIGGNSGGTDYSIGVRFDRPATFNEDTDFYAVGRIERLDEVSFQSDQASVEVGIKRYASEKREYTFGLGLRTADVSDAFGNRSYTLLTLPLSSTFDYRDNKLNAKDGYYLSAALTPFVAIMGSDNGARGYVDARAFKSFGETDRFTFALRGQLGSLSGPSLDNAPADYVFYSGGGGTVRGQDYQSLAVDLGNGREVGGRSFIGLSGEVRVETGDKFSVVGFYDAGYIGREEFPDGTSGDWHSGAGFGVRYDTGIGPIRLDLAVPVSGPGNQNGFEIYIGIGQAF